MPCIGLFWLKCSHIYLNDNQATACVVGYKQGIQERIYVGSQGLIQVDLNHPEVDSKLRVNCEQILKSK